ncbi:MAG TPA: hypothetical protein VKX46_07745 [Ktedonobacteraceae bacterium]|nr:hypothetical protein [Ktedonobacteraceae bacterium]
METRGDTIDQQRPNNIMKQLRVFAYEWRWAISWSWILPVVIILVSLFLVRATYEPLQNRQQGSEVRTAPHRTSATAETIDYASALRDDLEQYLPLAGVFLTISLLAQDWRRGALIQIALRQPLRRILYERLAYVLAYLVLLILIATPVSIALTPHAPDDGNLWLWLWNVYVTVIPSTMILIAISLLVAHSTVSTIAGYMLTASLWLANMLFAQSVKNSGGKDDLLLYLLFGWNDRTMTMTPENWWIGKTIIFVVALGLLLLQIPLLRHEARLLRYREE